MKNNYLIASVVFFFLLLNNINANTDCRINNSVLDLTGINCDDTIIKIDGYIDFYWREFLLPKSPSDSLIGHEKLKALVPKPWTKVVLANGTKLPPDGYATYRFQIKVKNETKVYGIKLFSIFTAYKLYVNEQLVTEVGTIGKTRDESKPNFYIQEIPIPVTKIDSGDYQMLDIVFQVSNFYHRRAGLKQPMFISTMHNIIRSTKDTLILHLLLIGIIFIIGFNHLLMYILRRNDISNLLFGALATIMILRDLTTGERILIHIFPHIDWELLVKLDNFSGFGTITVFTLYFYSIFKDDFPKFMYYFGVILGALITVLVFFTPQWFYGQFRIVMEAYVGLGGGYLTFGVLLTAAIRRRQGAAYTFVGMFLLYTTAINDVLSSMGVIDTLYIAPYGIAAFMFLQSFMVTKTSADAIKSNEKLSEELKQEKLLLEDRIEERTQKLTKQAEELKAYQKEQEQQNWINTGINELTDVMRENKENLEQLADRLLATMVKRIGATMGAMYFHTKDKDEEYLKLLANYGLGKDAQIDILDVNEGLTGKCFASGKENHIQQLPDKFFAISSGLGSSMPKILSIFPMKIDELIIGVVELASFKDITDTHKAYLRRAVEIIASQLNIVKMNAEAKILIEESKKLEKETSEKNEEMMKIIQEMEEVQMDVEKREKEFKDKIEAIEKQKTETEKELEQLKEELEKLKGAGKN